MRKTERAWSMSSLSGTDESSVLARALDQALTGVHQHGSRPKNQDADPWAAWPTSLLERLPLPYWLVVLVATVSALGDQMLEMFLTDPTFAGAGSLAGVSLVFPVLVIWILIHLRILKRATASALSDLRPAVHVSDEVYSTHARRLVQANPRVEVALLGVALGVVLLLFVGMRASLLTYAGGLPAAPLAAVFVVLNYTLLGWIILNLVYCSIRQAVALRGLAQLPLEINVFDPTNLLPFGRLGLIQSLPTVALILIPLILIGPPTQAGYLVIFLSLVSILSLFVPLWGVHRQIDNAKENALRNIYLRLLTIQKSLLEVDELDAQVLKTMADRTAMLSKLRELIQQSPNWPFKDGATVVRALAAVTSPLVYFLLNQLIGAYLVPLLTVGAP